MGEKPTIFPGVGREKYHLKSGKHPIGPVIDALEKLTVDARQCSVRVRFRNGSSRNLEHPSRLADISDLRQVASVFLHVVFADGSYISGRPINSPLGGYLTVDQPSIGAKPTKLRLLRGPADIAPSKKVDRDAQTISYQRGQEFKERWQEIEDRKPASFKRGMKYLSAIVAFGIGLWAFAYTFVTYTINGFPEQRRPLVAAPIFPDIVMAVLGYGLFAFTLAWHGNRFDKFFATRIFRPLVGPALRRLQQGSLTVLASTRAHLPMIIITFLVTVIGGVIVLQIGKALNLN